MTIKQMTDIVKGKYLGSAWAKKVDRMSEAQILAIYNRLKGTGALDKHEVVQTRIKMPVRSVTLFQCKDCGRAFASDIPDLKNCSFCNGNIIKVKDDRI